MSDSNHTNSRNLDERIGEKQLAPGEIVGGNCNLNQNYASCCVHAALFSRPARGECGGDICYLSHCESDRVTRVGIADVQGHGQEAAAISEAIFQHMRKYLNVLDNARLLNELNSDLFERGLRGLTTAIILSFHRKLGELHVSSAGHPAPFIHRQGMAGGWVRLDLPQGQMMLGVKPDNQYAAITLHLKPRDALFLFTDGLTELPEFSRDSQRGEEIVLAILNRTARQPVALKQAMLKELEHKFSDDTTFMALEIAP